MSEALEAAQASTDLPEPVTDGAAALATRANAAPGNLALRDELALATQSLADLEAVLARVGGLPGAALTAGQVRAGGEVLRQQVEALTALHRRAEEELAQLQENAKAVLKLHDEYLRGASPSDELRQLVNRGFVPTGQPDSVLPGQTINEPLEADHIVALDTIKAMPGFRELSTYNQVRMLNNPLDQDYSREAPVNFVALSKSANGSKGDMTFAEWKAHLLQKGRAFDEAFLDRMIARERQLAPVLAARIQLLLREERSARTP